VHHGRLLPPRPFCPPCRHRAHPSAVSELWVGRPLRAPPLKPSNELISRKRRWLRRVGIGIAVFLVLYVGSYVVLSATGGWVVSESGELRMFLAVSDIFEWQPRYGSCERFRWSGGDYGLRADALGYFYAPLILFDQHFIHRTIRFLQLDGSFAEPLPAPPYADYHPLRENRFSHRFPYEQSSDRK
jgi:hypothetical protein